MRVGVVRPAAALATSRTAMSDPVKVGPWGEALWGEAIRPEVSMGVKPRENCFASSLRSGGRSFCSQAWRASLSLDEWPGGSQACVAPTSRSMAHLKDCRAAKACETFQLERSASRGVQHEKGQPRPARLPRREGMRCKTRDPRMRSAGLAGVVKSRTTH